MSDTAGEAMQPCRNLHGRIHAAYETLSPVDRRLADLILNFPANLPGYSAAELAQMASTSNAAVSRFVRRLSFGSYEEMRRQAREEGESGTPVYLISQAGQSAEPSDLLLRHAKTAVSNIRSTADGINRADFEAFTRRLAKARRVWIAGFRHGFAVATYLRWELAHARSDVHLLPSAGETLGEHLIDLSSDDVLVLMAMRRRVPAITRIIGAAQRAGAPVALLCDPGMVDVSAATWAFRVHTATKGPIDDHASALMLVHAITEAVIAHVGPSARDRFSGIDDLHQVLGEL